jgi:hypothetical protein
VLSRREQRAVTQAAALTKTGGTAVDREEMAIILQHLLHRGLIATDSKEGFVGLRELIDDLYKVTIQVTPKGWEVIRQRSMPLHTNKVFIATQFEWPEKSLHGEAMEAVKKACKNLGYDADFVGQNHTGNITDRIVADIRKSRFVVAEFTYNNRGVYFESGLARGYGIPVFHLVRDGFTDGRDEDGKKVHFDLAQVMYRKWSTPKDLEKQLYDWIEATLGRFSP